MYLDQMDLPGGDDFVDVTAIFAGAAQREQFIVFYAWTNRTLAELDATEMIFADGYSLNDAMSALEVWKCASVHVARSPDPRIRLGNRAWIAGWFSKKRSARHLIRWRPSYLKKYVGFSTARFRAR